ncbi:MAG: hypothetical protein K0Q53_2486 [Massilibacillus sp.]|jgi:uncharacterized protein VirK/YbjX|nr:hypothetical protein [Massilibacillus sp.]
MKECISLGKRIYCHRDTSDFGLQRLLVFIVRAKIHKKQVNELLDFFSENPTLVDIEENNPIIFEQLTRHVFYHQSTLDERLAFIKQHFICSSTYFRQECLNDIYNDGALLLWEEAYGDDKLCINLNFKYVDRKEGLMSIELTLGKERIYHITFWLDQSEDKERTLWIGALQGILGGANIIHDLTKHFFAYRPKNLILYALRTVACTLGISKIYAVSNEGFFTNTHVRLDKKLKTLLDEFWQETGGSLCEDHRFFELPVIEVRKSIEEVKSQKRNLYRKRYAALDEIEKGIKYNLNSYLKVKNNVTLVR